MGLLLCLAALLSTVVEGANVNISLFVMSKCPDAAHCETAFLPEVLRRVGSIVDLQVDYIAAPEASAPSGFSCMHGESECEGDAAQLCVQRYFPAGLNIDSLGSLSWTAFLRCVDDFNSSSTSKIPENTAPCLTSLGVDAATVKKIEACAAGPEGRELMRESVERTLHACPKQKSGRCTSCTMLLNGEVACIADGGVWPVCPVGTTADAWTAAVCKAYEGPGPRPAACSEIVLT